MTITLYPTEEILLGTVSIWRVGISLRWGFLFAIVLAWIWQRIFPSRTWLEIFGEIWLLAFFVWALIMIFKRSLVQITLTEEEIQISQFGKERAIAWKDARLFSVIAVKRHGADTYYELSSEQRILRWNWDRSPRGLLHSASLQEYNQQMEAVLAIIVAKTGLTLYDLRNMPIPS